MKPAAKPTADGLPADLRPLGTASDRRVRWNHGVPDTVFKVRVEERKEARKRVGKDYRFALDPSAPGCATLVTGPGCSPTGR